MAPEQLREHRGSRAVRAKDRADAPRLDARRHLRPAEHRGKRGAGAGVEREAVHGLLPTFCLTLAILQSCKLAAISQGLVLGCIDAIFCK